MRFPDQALHVFREDVRRFWPGLVAVAVLIGVHRTMGLPVTIRYVEAFQGPPPVFPLLLSLFTVVLIQHQRLSGGATFWSTRPLHPLALLVGKGLFILLFFCLVPVAVHVQWIQELAGGGDTALLFGTSMLYQAALLSLVAAGASVTSGIPAFAALAVPVWMATEILLDWRPFLDYWGPQPREALEPAVRWSWLVVGGLTVLHQYMTRRTARSAVLGTALLLVATFGIVVMRPTPDGGPVAATEREPYGEASAVRLQAASLSMDISERPDGPAVAHLELYLQTEPGPPVLLAPTSVRATLSGDGVRYVEEYASEDANAPVFSMRPLFDPSLPVDGIHPAGRRGRPYRPSPLSIPVAVTGPDRMETLSDADRLDLELEVDVFRPVLHAEVPLKSGMEQALDEGTLSILRVHRSPRSVGAQLVFRLALPESVRHYRQLDRAGALHIYSARYHEYQHVGGGGPGVPPDFERIAPAQYLVGGTILEEEFRSAIASLDWAVNGDPLPEDWLEEAALLLIEPLYLGSFHRTLSISLDSLPRPRQSIRLSLGGGREEGS